MSSRSRHRRPNRRLRRIRAALVMTVAGCGVLAASGYRLQQERVNALQELGDSVTSSSVATVPEDAPQMVFVDVAEQVGIDMRHGPGRRNRLLSEDTGSGLAWADVDSDGDFDLYLVNYPSSADSGAAAWNRLFRNDGGEFVDITSESGTADPDGFGMGASFADFDEDGDVDLYVTNLGPNRLFRNRGDGTFEDVASQLGVADPLWSVGSAWGDFDRDGRLDLYVTNYLAIESGVELLAGSDSGSDPNWQSLPLTLNPNAFDPQPNRLYRGRADGGFEELALLVGASNPEGRSLGATVVDLDGDEWLDLYVANDVSPNALFLNLGARHGELLFEDASWNTGTADPRGSMGIAVTDVLDSDGLPDLFVTHWVAQENALYHAVAADDRRLEYRDKTRHLGLGEISTDRVGWGAAFVDLDLDGRRDLVVANGSTLEDGSEEPALVAQPMFLFWNTGTAFVDLAPRAGATFARPHSARGLAVADYDSDGDIDLAVSVNRGRPLLLRNEGEPANDWLAIRLAGSASQVFGARLKLSSGERQQMAWWGAGVSFASGHAPEVVFGRGPEAAASTLVVEWAGGEETTVAVPAGSQRLTVRFVPDAVDSAAG